jgi:hypothetical protein
VKNGILIAMLGAAAAAAPPARAQIPPDLDTISLIAIDDGGQDIIRILVTHNLEVGRWRAGTEYWYAAADLGKLGTQALHMKVTHLDPETDPAEIAGMIGDFDLSFSVAQEVGEEAWRLAQTPTDCSNQSLFQAQDPDDPGASIGILIEQDERTGGLRASTWFKTFNTGRIFDSTPESLTFDPTLDQGGILSCDPEDIDPVAWFYFRAGTP